MSDMTETELQLLGLKTLADGYSRKIDDLRDAACALTGDVRDGHTYDWIYDHRDRRTPAEILAAVKR